MIIMGVDSSSSCTGITILDDGKLVATEIWVPQNKKAPVGTRLFQFHRWFRARIKQYEPDRVGLETVSVSRGHQTTKVLAYYEAAVILACESYKIVWTPWRVKQARASLFGQGGMTKRIAYKTIVKNEKKHLWRPYDKGGNDETDSYVIAKAEWMHSRP